MTTELTLDGVALSTAVPEAMVTKVARSLLPAVRDVYVDIPGRAGAWLYPEQPGDATMSATVEIVGEPGVGETAFEARRRACRALARWVDTAGRARLVVDDEPDRYRLVKLATAPTADEWLTQATVALEWRSAPYALALVVAHEQWLSDNTAHELVVDDGDVPVAPVIEVTATDGNVVGLTLHQLAPYESTLFYGGTILAGETITISTVSYTVTTGPNDDAQLEGDFDPETLDMATVTGDWPMLAPGANSLRLEALSGNDATVDVYWRPAYRG